MFETASFHIIKSCNMNCSFCYATFDDMHINKQLSFSEAQDIVYKLAEAGLQKITFAGGEPMLYKNLDEIIKFSKRIGLTTSIITNGSMIRHDWLMKMKPYLDWIGISVDSIYAVTNSLTGRNAKTPIDYLELLKLVKGFRYKIKINTVVNKFNKNECMSEFIKWVNPDRWKIFQTLLVTGQNEKKFNSVSVSDEEFQRYLSRHRQDGVNFVAEDNDLMTGSYLLIDPKGRIFENSKGFHTYSDPLQFNTIEHCLSQLNLNREKFIKRGGIYSW
jgi:radical S-adenosyl methionine domain-containing protein 2